MRTYGLRFDVNCSILFTELPATRRPAAAKAAGFGGVEFWWPWEAVAPSDAPVVMLFSPRMSSSAQRPPRIWASWSSSSALLTRYLSSLVRLWVHPCAMPVLTT